MRMRKRRAVEEAATAPPLRDVGLREALEAAVAEMLPLQVTAADAQGVVPLSITKRSLWPALWTGRSREKPKPRVRALRWVRPQGP